MPSPANRVLLTDASRSQNFFQSDRILSHYLEKHISIESMNYMRDKLNRLGQQAATEMDDLSMKADQYSPVLKKRSKLGEPIDEIEFHPAYWKLIDIAARSEMFYLQYDPDLRKQNRGERHALAFATGQLYAMSELGAYCPLCMTDGAAHLVKKFAPDDMKERLLPKLSAREGSRLMTGAMFLTEKSGGSDVGRNLCTAEKMAGRQYRLQGEKWFCSNVNADVIMTLARTGARNTGTRGLSLFLVEPKKPDGSRNPMSIIRLKDKLGVRSMATGEVMFEGTRATLLGEENEGFKLMAQMITVSRTYNSIGAVAVARRALAEAYQYLQYRVVFKKKAVQHALIRQKFHELGARYVGIFLLVWRTIRAMDAAEQGDEKARHLMRILVPIAKWQSAKFGVYCVRECMELMGGNGYIEDFVMPKLLRDINVLPIWEGSGNIIVLDVLRAVQKSDGLALVIKQIKQTADGSDEYGDLMHQRVAKLNQIFPKLKNKMDRDTVEATAKPLFGELSELYQLSLMVEELEEASRPWIIPSLKYFAAQYHSQIDWHHPISPQQVNDLMGWMS